MVMTYQIADTVNDLLGPGKSGKHGPRLARSLQLLIFSGIPSILLFRLVNSDIMNDGCRLEDFLSIRIELFLQTDQPCKFVDL